MFTGVLSLGFLLLLAAVAGLTADSPSTGTYLVSIYYGTITMTSNAPDLPTQDIHVVLQVRNP